MIYTIKIHPQYKTSTKIILTLIVVFCTIGLPIVTLSAYQYNRYRKGVFDCDDMSKELEPILEKLGFDTKLVYGRNKANSSAPDHCWLLVNGLEFESTTLAFDKRSNEFEPYVIYEGEYYKGKKLENPVWFYPGNESKKFELISYKEGNKTYYQHVEFKE